MTDRIMLVAVADENTVRFRTACAGSKSPQCFYVTYWELDRLQRDGNIISSDIHSFAKIRLDGRRDLATFEFTWLTGRCSGRVEGFEQTVHLRWPPLRDFLEACRRPDGPREFKAVSMDPSRQRPQLVFDGKKANLHAAIGDPRIRRKLGKALMDNFNWPGADEIRLYDDFAPYSFFFREYRDGRSCLCGGLILHGQEDMGRAYYGIHT